MELNSNWKSLLFSELESEYFLGLQAFLEHEYLRYQIFPPRRQIFRAFDLCSVENLKVVVLGQDPYHGVGQANGLCFSVNTGVKQPPSLKNILKELALDLGISPPENGELDSWASQGVLMLNAIFTVRAHQAGSHRNKGWEVFSDAVIRTISQKKEHLVFLLWGSFAQSKEHLIDTGKHLVLKSVHPSPLSAHRGFFGNKHFSKANAFLVKNNIKPINWNSINE